MTLMIISLVSGFLGLFLSLMIGNFLLDINMIDLLSCVGISNLAAFVALLTTLRIERTLLFLKYTARRRAIKTWIFLAILYFGLLIVFVPMLRNPSTLLIFSIPLVLSTGFSILVFGPIQDRLIWRQQQHKIQEEECIECA